MKELTDLEGQLAAEYSRVQDSASLQDLKDRWFSREKGLLSLQLRKLGTLDKALRPSYGNRLNQLKAEFSEKIEGLQKSLREREEKEKRLRRRQDVYLPGKPALRGFVHPLVQVKEEIESVFVRMGFTLYDTPEVETDFRNFEGLNIPKDHPSRDSQDTFFLGGEYLLRTHCTGVQMHAMKTMSPPMRVIATGKVYRRDSPDATHSPVFHQCDGFIVGENITLGDLKGTLEAALKELFSPDIQVRLRPSYFPFVEPGAEVDISCIFCSGKGCRICKDSGWIEILGAGMIHPRVFEYVGYDPARWTGFAWGMGIDRIAILKYGIDDIRLFFENDMRFLSQF